MLRTIDAVFINFMNERNIFLLSNLIHVLYYLKLKINIDFAKRKFNYFSFINCYFYSAKRQFSILFRFVYAPCFQAIVDA